MSSNGSRGQWLAVGVIVTMLGAALTIGVMLSEDIFQVQPGTNAPDFNAVNLASGDSVTLADYKGEVVLLNLWATWCAPCRVEMPSMERLYRELGPEGLKIVAVSVDQLGGDLRAENREAGGARFALDIPIEPSRTEHSEGALHAGTAP